MKTLFNMKRWVTALVLAGFAVAALSPAAHAGHRWRRYKDAPGYCPPPAARHVHHAPRRVVYYERHSNAAPLFAGLIGGIVIGSALAHASAPAYEPAHYYWDPWCHVRFTSLGIYRSHFRHHHHPRVVRVISVETVPAWTRTPGTTGTGAASVPAAGAMIGAGITAGIGTTRRSDV